MPQQSAEGRLTLDGSDRRIVGVVEHLGRDRRGVWDGAVTQALMWAMAVVERNEFLADVIEVMKPEAQKVIERVLKGTSLITDPTGVRFVLRSLGPAPVQKALKKCYKRGRH